MDITTTSFHSTQINRMIVIILSRLRMSVEDATEEFHGICNEVYVDGLSATERTGRLRKAIEGLLTRRGLPVDLKLGRNDTTWGQLIQSENY